jgi:hypothetical protein
MPFRPMNRATSCGTAVARDTATPRTPNTCFRPAAPTAHATTAARATTAAAGAWRSRTVSSRAAAGAIGATVLGCAAAIEVARAWTDAPHAGAAAEQIVGGVVVALFVTAAFGLLVRADALSSVAVASVFALVAHGGTLVLGGELCGAIFLGIAPFVALLAQATFAVDDALETTAAREAFARARLLALWMKTSRRRRTASAAARAASPIPLAMRASQATIIDAWVKTPNSSSRGSATPRSCASNA